MKNSESEEHAKYLALIQQLNNLEQEWNSLKKSRPRNPRPCLKSSDNTSCITTSFHQLLENSPRGFMSSLRRRNSPSNRVVRVKNSDMAVEEIFMDRMAVIMSGKLKGRRLFRAEEEECKLNYGGGGGGGGETCRDWFKSTIQEREVVMNDDQLPVAFKQSCSFSDSSSSEEKVMVEEEKTVVEVANSIETRGDDGRRRSGGWCMTTALAWFVVVLVLIALGLVYMSCNGKYVQKSKLILVPT